jgi:hypothetical protein
MTWFIEFPMARMHFRTSLRASQQRILLAMTPKEERLSFTQLTEDSAVTMKLIAFTLRETPATVVSFLSQSSVSCRSPSEAAEF